MTEPVRLVIWDLDDTFWSGTLSEGPITHLDAHEAIVRTLAKRGIISSICSKNDHAPVEAVLTERGIWDHFVFPSINWEAKGPRVAALVEAVQLRPETILFVDDNPMNRNEVQHYVPGIQVADETTILSMLDDPLFKGKDDSKLTRLDQYRLLQRRKADESAAAQASGDNHEFLRSSGIRVTIDYDVAPHLDRAIELINRTNQLNFTKRRLPEDIEAARGAMRDMIRRHNVMCGMVRVRDSYGDYGWSGFFAVKRTSNRKYILHFAFSCRILNMGVEQWLYRHLGSPQIEVVGPVSAELPGTIDPDWITIDDGRAAADTQVEKVLAFAGLRGSCDLRPLEHYFGAIADEVASELMFVRRGLQLRFDHSQLVIHALQPPAPAFITACTRLNYVPDDFQAASLANGAGKRVHVLSFRGDTKCALYRHNETGLMIPMRLRKGAPSDYTLDPPAKLMGDATLAGMLQDELRRDFTYVGRMTDAMISENMALIYGAIDPASLIIQVLPDEQRRRRVYPSRVRYNAVVREVAGAYPNVRLIKLSQFATQRADIRNIDHFDRMVYFRFFQHVRDLVAGAETAPGDADVPVAKAA